MSFALYPLAWYLASSAGLSELVVMFPTCILACCSLHRYQQLRRPVLIHAFQGQTTYPVVIVLGPAVQLGGFPQETLPEVTPDLIPMCGVWLIPSPSCWWLQPHLISKPVNAVAQPNPPTTHPALMHPSGSDSLVGVTLDNPTRPAPRPSSSAAY